MAEHGVRRAAAVYQLVQEGVGERGWHQDSALLGARHEGGVFLYNAIRFLGLEGGGYNYW